jgi:hypothetical protein
MISDQFTTENDLASLIFGLGDFAVGEVGPGAIRCFRQRGG